MARRVERPGGGYTEIREGVEVCDDGMITIDITGDFTPVDALGLVKDIRLAVQVSNETVRNNMKAILMQPNPIFDSVGEVQPWEDATWD
jgi:hypothetical protein